MGIKIYAYLIAGILAIGAIGGGLWYVHNLRATNQLLTKALGESNAQVDTANQNLAKAKGVIDAQNHEAQQLRAEQKAAARLAATRKRQLDHLLAGRPSPAAAAALNQRVRAALESIQGHVFDNPAAAAYAAPPGIGAYCLDTSSTGNLVTDLETIAADLNEIDPPAAKGGGK